MTYAINRPERTAFRNMLFVGTHCLPERTVNTFGKRDISTCIATGDDKMPRPKKCRKVCCMPAHTEFVPVCGSACEIKDTVFMTVDEYETIRLIDKEGFSQEECSRYMGVARTTIQQIYNNARRKIAEAIVDGRKLRIEGGDYRLCDGSEKICTCGGCQRHRALKRSQSV